MSTRGIGVQMIISAKTVELTIMRPMRNHRVTDLTAMILATPSKTPSQSLYRLQGYIPALLPLCRPMGDRCRTPFTYVGVEQLPGSHPV